MPQIDVLFAYGTLMTSAAASPTGRRERQRLAREARSLGPASVPGRLVDLGRYPGLVEGGPGIVHGEALQLADPDTTLAWLDAYEGIVPGERGRTEYIRAARTIRLEPGQDLTAWVYVYQPEATGRPEIPGGRWVVPAR